MTQEEMEARLRELNDRISEWPANQRALLDESLEPMLPVPRKPIDNRPHRLNQKLDRPVQPA